MSNQALIIDSDKSYSAVLRMYLIKSLGLEIVEKSSSEEAIEFLEILPTISILIVKENEDTEDVLNPMIRHLELTKKSIPILFIGKKTIETSLKFINIPEMGNFSKIATSISSLLNVEMDLVNNLSNNDYEAIPLDFFLNINTLEIDCDIFIRIKKSDAEFHYVKRLHSGDHLSRKDIENYRENGLKDFYISKKHFSKFVDYVTNDLLRKLESDQLLGDERLQLASDVLEVTRERIEMLGVDQHTVKLVDQSIKSMMKSLSEKNSLTGLLDKLKADQMSFAYTHSYFIALLLYKVVDTFEWKTSSIKDKLCYVAYFHDISLKDDHQMKVANMDELEALALTSKERQDVLQHAQKSADLLNGFSEIPLGVSTIIKEHHGSKNGFGFPLELNLAISPLSMSFMVVEEFVTNFLTLDNRPTIIDLKFIFERLATKYHKSTYKEALNALEKLTLNK